jgi:hypothetical protein
MGMTSFYAVFPKLAETEVRTVTIPPGSDLGTPAGIYGFGESYCDEPGCDCRRVMISIISKRTRASVAHINMGFDADGEMAGPFLDPLNPQGPPAAALLRFFTHMINRDADYLARLQRHYVLFKEHVDRRPYSGPPFAKPGEVKRVAQLDTPRPSLPSGARMRFPSPTVRRDTKIGRNAPCPCGSGKKYKRCCMGTLPADRGGSAADSRSR